MRKRFVWMLLVILLCAAAVFVTVPFPVIGRIYGPENNYIEIDGEVYVHTQDRPYTAADRGKYLGAAKNEAVTMRLYKVHGDELGEWIFALWEWEGYFYRKDSGGNA